MSHFLVFLSIVTLFTGCQRIELKVSQRPVQEQDLPHKTYTAIGNVCQAADGGFSTVLTRTAFNRALTAYSDDVPYAERSEVVVVKTDPSGQVQWTKFIQVGATKPLLHPLSDGGYFVLLFSVQYALQSANQRLTLIHLNSAGEVLTTQTVDGVRLDGTFTAQKILALADKGFVVSGSTGRGRNAVLMRFDEQGRLQWTHTYEQITEANTYGLAATSDGGFMLSWSGYTSGLNESYLLKTDGAGQPVWLRKYGLLAASSVSASNDGGFVLLGKNPSNSTYLILFKLDNKGDVQWTKTYPLSSSQQYVTPLGVFASDQAYVLAYPDNSGLVELVTTNLAGAEQSRQTVYGASISEETGSVSRLADGSLLFLGRRAYYMPVILTKTKPDNTVQWSSPIATNT